MARPTLTSLDGENRKMLEQRAREATRPVVPITRGKWPFPVEKNSPSARGSRDTDATPSDKPTSSGE